MAYFANPRVYVIDFPGTSTDPTKDARGHVMHPRMWPLTKMAIGTAFFWEGYVMPRDANSTYWAIDGAGGRHTLLCGFSQSAPGAMNFPFFLTDDGTEDIGFVADDGLMPFNWAHIAHALGTDSASGSQMLVAYLNGIPVGQRVVSIVRHSVDAFPDACGDLYVGGSDHSNFNGRVAQIRAFDQVCPLSYMQQSFIPESEFSPYSYDGEGTFIAADFVARYMVPNERIVPDLSSAGYNGGDPDAPKIFHPGRVYGSFSGGSRGFPSGTISHYPGPRWVADPTAPFGGQSRPHPDGFYQSPRVPTPVGAVLFDSFDRSQVVPAFDETLVPGTADLGGTWTTGLITGESGTTSRWGILNGRAVPLDIQLASSAFLDSGSATQDVRVSRIVGTNGIHHTGLTFRQQDRDNYWWCYTNSETGPTPTLYLGLILAGSGTVPIGQGDFVTISTTVVTGWDRLRVTASGTTITVYVGVESGLFDGNNFPLYTWTQVEQLTGQTYLQTATKCGLAGVQYNANLVHSRLRMDNFEAR